MRAWIVAGALALLVLPCASTGLADSRRDPLPAFLFSLKIEGVDAAATGFFKSVGGLEMETEVVEFEEGGDDDLVRKLPGRRKFGDLVLERPFAGELPDDPVQDWVRALEAGEDVRKDVTISLLDRNGTEVARYDFFEAWPSKWELCGLDSDKGGVVVEKITIAVERIERVSR
jgi:phage tail-like protein